MTLISDAVAAGIMHRVVEILADAMDSPTRQMRAGERWIRKSSRRSSDGS